MNGPLDTIVKLINGKIEKNLSGRSEFSGSKFHGIANRVRQTIGDPPVRIIFPAVPVGDTGEMIQIAPTDFLPFESYHRSISITNSIADETGYGRKQGKVRSIFSMALVAIVNKRLTKIDEVSTYLLMNSALTFTGASESFSFISSASTGANINSDEVINQEFVNIEFPIDYMTKIFRITYSITTEHDPSCVPGCK